MKIILASSSPRRKQILSELGLDISVVEPHIDESILADEKAIAYTRRVAQEKGLSVFMELQPVFSKENLIISADTTVVFYGKILGKPQDEQEARSMLALLNGRKHYVITALSLIHSTTEHRQRALAHAVSVVKFRNLHPDEMDLYLKGHEWSGKAGGYAIHGYASSFIEYFQGSLSSIIGFPLRTFFRMLVGMDIDPLSLGFVHETNVSGILNS